MDTGPEGRSALTAAEAGQHRLRVVQLQMLKAWWSEASYQFQLRLSAAMAETSAWMESWGVCRGCHIIGCEEGQCPHCEDDARD